MEEITIFSEILAGLKDVTEKPHFEKKGYSVEGRLFATVDAKHTLGCVKLSLEAQNQFTEINKTVYPVPNNWGKKGWTYLNLSTIPESLLAEIIQTAYRENKKAV
jgi:hypothetical protein